MLKKTSKLALNFKILRFFLLPTVLFSTSFFYSPQDVKAGLEFQWEQATGFRRLKCFQKENKKRFRNTIYFFLRPSDRNSERLKITLAIPPSFKANVKEDKISLCKVKIGGFEDRTKCLENIPADVEINTDESSLRSINIYPFSPIPSNKENYAITLKLFNPKKAGLYQFHSYGQLKGKSVSSYLGSWTIVID